MLHSDPAFDAFFRRTVVSVAPYAGALVCIGGCANALFRHHSLAKGPWLAFLGTMDVDWAVPNRLPVPTDAKPLSDLLDEAGFEEEVFGTATQPVVKYRPREHDLAAEIEFLCPLSGARGARRAGTLASTEVQPGLYAQPLRYLELLLHKPWRVGMASIPGFEDVASLYVLVPNPAAYVVQKVLARSQGRDPESMAKDCYYIYEVSVIFRQALEDLHAECQAMKTESPAWARWLAAFTSSAKELFRAETSEGATAAVRIHGSTASNGGGALTSYAVCRSVQRLLDALV